MTAAGWRLTWEGKVEAEWLDELDHVNFLAYQQVADKGGLILWRQLSGDRDFESRGGNEFVMTETQVRYLRELYPADPVQVLTALCAHDDKRFQLLHRVVGPHGVAATVETVNLSFHMQTRKVQRFTPQVQNALERMGLPPSDAIPDLPLKRERF